jgi:hypothetical protein
MPAELEKLTEPIQILVEEKAKPMGKFEELGSWSFNDEKSKPKPKRNKFD